MYEVDNHPNIEILTNTEVRKVSAANGGFKVRLVKKAKFIDEEKCTGCGECVEACPVTVPDEMDGKIGGTRKLISMPFPQAVPNVAVMDQDCRTGKMRANGACVGGCVVDCSQCRECPIAFCVEGLQERGQGCGSALARPARTSTSMSRASWSPPGSRTPSRPRVFTAMTFTTT